VSAATVRETTVASRNASGRRGSKPPPERSIAGREAPDYHRRERGQGVEVDERQTIEIRRSDGSILRLTPDQAQRLVRVLLDSEAFGAVSMASQIKAATGLLPLDELTHTEEAALTEALDRLEG
jgi:hypothetical protein